MPVHPVLLPVPTGKGVPVAVGVLAGVPVLSLQTGTMTEGNSCFDRLSYSESKLVYITENTSFGNIYL